MERNGSKGIHLDGNWCSMCSANLCITSFIHVYIFMLVFCVRSVSKPWASQPWDVAMCRAQACPLSFAKADAYAGYAQFCLREVLIFSDCLSPSQLLVRIRELTPPSAVRTLLRILSMDHLRIIGAWHIHTFFSGVIVIDKNKRKHNLDTTWNLGTVEAPW